MAHDAACRHSPQDISRRLGNLRDGAKDIKSHAFFSEIDWDNPYHYRGSIRPSPFDRNKYQWVGAETVVTETKKMREEDQSLFDNFTA